MPLPWTAKQRYIKHPHFCPYCGADEIDAGRIEHLGEDFAIQPVTCSPCGKEWDDVYELTGIEERESPSV